MNYIVIDTCVVLHVMRNNTQGQQAMAFINSQPNSPALIVSVVTKAELESLKIQWKMGSPKRNFIDAFLKQATIVDIHHTDSSLLQAYAAIDAYSKGKGTDKFGNPKVGSAVVIGKNDVWMAATAYVLQATMLTADGDFDPLHGCFIDVVKV